jgi:hypothetical protein
MTNRWPHTSAFVLQFPAGTDLEAGPFAGRIEHVASGRTAHFHTPEELRTFLAQVLAEVGAKDAEGSQDPSLRSGDLD